MKQNVQSDGSAKAKNLSARLMAVQVIYQSLQSGHPMKKTLEEYIAFRNPPMSEEEQLVSPDGALLEKIVLGVEERGNDLAEMIRANYTKKDGILEPLLQAIMLCAAYELIGNMSVDAPIILNDYLNVTHSFYEQGEVSLVNGILNSMAKAVR